MQVKLCPFEILLGLYKIGAESFGIVKPELNVNSLFGFKQVYSLLRLFGFLLKRTHLRGYLEEHVVDTSHILLGCLQLSLGIALLKTVLCDSRSVLKYTSSLVALARDYLGYLTLTDYRISVTSDTRIHKHLVNITQTHSAAVDKILALSRAVIASCDSYLVVRTVQPTYHTRVVKGNGDLGVSHRLSTVSSAEDDILHLRSSDALRGHLSQHPTHSV